VKKSILILLVLLVSCTPKDKYDPAKFYDANEQAELLAGIVTYIFSAPPYTLMEDRFKAEHRIWYRQTSARLFKLDRLYVDHSGRHYYLVLRPGVTADDKRAAGGYFDVANENEMQFRNFHEAFVTPILPDSTVKERGRFLFDQMVKGDIEKYLKMKTYVQWPNAVSYYDSTTYEWKMDLTETDETDSLDLNSYQSDSVTNK
jgi:hypothetical protein